MFTNLDNLPSIFYTSFLIWKIQVMVELLLGLERFQSVVVMYMRIKTNISGKGRKDLGKILLDNKKYKSKELIISIK